MNKKKEKKNSMYILDNVFRMGIEDFLYIYDMWERTRKGKRIPPPPTLI